MIEPGAPAPDFTLPDQDGNEVSLADLRGQTVVLVFYPVDFSPVCTDQLNVYQEVLGELEQRGVRAARRLRRLRLLHKAFQDAARHRRSRCSPTSTRRARSPQAYGVWSRSTASAQRALVMIGPDGEVDVGLPVAARSRCPAPT